MPEPTGETTLPPDTDVPVRRVSFTVTGYLRHGHPIGGHYDMQTQADGGMAYSIPDFQVDETTVRDAPPEQLSRDDWNEITGHVLARYGRQDGGRLLAAWDRAMADVDAERAQAFQAARRLEPAGRLDQRAVAMEATLKRARALAVEWSAVGGESAATWRDACRLLHAALDGPSDEESGRA